MHYRLSFLKENKLASYLVTGGAGFIGSHLVDRLLKMGEKVIVVDNFDDYYDPRIKRDNIKTHLDNKNFTLREVDLRDKQSLEEIFQSNRINKVIHLAARAGVRASLKNPFIYEEVNIKGTLNLLEACKRYPLESFIFVSSSSVYGTTDKIPFLEEERLGKLVSFYAVSKYTGEIICYTYHHLHHIPITCLRLFTVYGPRQRPEMAIHKFIRLISQGKKIDIFGNGSSRRDYTYISDIIDGMMQVLDKRRLGFEVFNLGSSKMIELRRLISLIEDLLGKKARMRYLPEQPGDLPVTHADVSKARKMLGYNPKIKIEEGIAKTLDWFKGRGNKIGGENAND